MNNIQTRLITSFQSTGRLGRSTLHQALLSWFSYADIPFSAVDADSEHKTLSTWYPTVTTFYPYHLEQDLLPLVNEAGGAPVELIDFPAQATESILSGMRRFGAAKIFAKRGIRLTVCIFASGDKAPLYSAAQIHSELQDEAEYIIVTNSARIEKEYHDLFFSSKLAQQLKGCCEINIPPLTGNTLQALAQLNKSRKQTLTFRQAEPFLKDGNTHELEDWRNQLFTQFEDNASVLLPDPALIKNKVDRIARKAASVVDPYDL